MRPEGAFRKELDMGLYFPMYVDLSSKRVLFIGGGKIAARRIASILDFAGSVTVVAPEVEPVIKLLADNEMLTLHQRRFSEDDLDDADIVCAAMGHPGTEVRIGGMCRRRGILFNAASDESLCDFCFPGIVRRDPLVIGVSASGEDHELDAKAT